MNAIIPFRQSRWYQEEAAEIGFQRITAGPGIHPIIAVPTAAGKSYVLCLLVDKVISDFPREEILIISHVQEIIEQDYDELRNYFEWDDESEDYLPRSNIGIYNAGLDKKEIKKITVASIQSIYRKPEKFKRFKHIFIDECHLIGMKESGMYRKFLAKMEANFLGLTATPFRSGYGYLHVGDDALFTELCYDLTSMENFNRLTDEGYLCKIVSKKTELRLNVDGIKMLGTDFNEKQLSERIDRKAITTEACKEVIAVGNAGDYKRWLFFCIDINHANNTKLILEELGVSAICIHSKIDDDRKELIKESKTGKYRAVITVGMLVTGYNDPRIDLIVHLRPSQSPVFHVQSNGRGLRCLYEDGHDLSTIAGRLTAQLNIKPHTRVMDFAGNARRLGPINDVYIRQKGEKGSGGPMIKDCPVCEAENHLSAKVCAYCGAEFPTKEKLQAKEDEDYEMVRVVDNKPIITYPTVPTWYTVDRVHIGIKNGGGHEPDVFVVTHTTECGRQIQEAVRLDSTGYARHMAKFWVKNHLRDDIEVPESMIPETVEELYSSIPLLKFPSEIEVDFKKSKKYPHFQQRVFV